jgi:ABC-2 type transport system permease protein
MEVDTMMVDERQAPGRAGFGDVLAAEWVKLRSVRSGVWTLAAMAAFVVGIAVFVGATGSLQPDDTVLGGSLTGATLGLLVGASFGVLVMSSEYTSGTIRATVAACPHRGVVLAAKATVVAATMYVVALAACTLAYLAGVAQLSGGGYAAGSPLPALFGVALCFSVTGVLGLAVGTLVRHSAGAITAMTAGILVPSLLAPLLGDKGRWLAGVSPMAAVQKLAQSSDATAEAVGRLGAWPSLGLLCGYAALALVAATFVFRRRDA